MRFADQVVIVTGGAHGIGRACVEAFAAEGAAVVIADIDAADGENAAQAIAGQGGRARFIRTDVGDAGQAQRLVDQTLQAFGRLDVLINNAGHHQDRGFPRDQRGRLRRRAARQPEGRVPGRPGGGARHGQAGQGRDRQHVLGQCRGRDREPGALRRPARAR